MDEREHIPGWAISILERLARIESDVTGIQRQQAADLTALQRQQDAIAGQLVWTVRLVVGAVLIAVVGLVIKGGLPGMGE